MLNVMLLCVFVCKILRPQAFRLLAGSKEWKRNIRLIYYEGII